MASERWKILRSAIIKPATKEGTELSAASVRTFSTFSLFRVSVITHSSNDAERWFFYSQTSDSDGSHAEIKVCIKILDPRVSLEAMVGFNNTGNVCIWPAEEVLAYHCLEERLIFKKANICELGCGMTGLAGIMLACSNIPSWVLLTDGNQVSVQNVKEIVAANKECFGATDVSCDHLVWNSSSIKEEYCGRFDYVLCADCLFFEHLQKELAIVIHKLLKPNEGIALIFAPRRGETLAQFCRIAEDYFKVELNHHYNVKVWKVHHDKPNGYNEDLHYPLKITLRNSREQN